MTICVDKYVFKKLYCKIINYVSDIKIHSLNSSNTHLCDNLTKLEILGCITHVQSYIHVIS
jgi:hypothetical protein